MRWSPDGTRISYDRGGWIYVVDVATAAITKVEPGDTAEWYDDHTLAIGPGGS
jgi:hypothetical protein